MKKYITIFILILVVQIAIIGYSYHQYEANKPYDPITISEISTNPQTYKITDKFIQAHSKICINSKVPITVYGELDWSSVVPAGSHILVAKGTGTISKDNLGCKESDSKIPIPKAVIDIEKSQGTDMTWKISAIITPSNHAHAVTHTYESQPFTITLH